MDFKEMRDADMLDYHDYPRVREDLNTRIATAVAATPPQENDQYIMRVDDVRYEGPETFTRTQQKKALQEGRTLSRRLRGTVHLIDKGTGKEVAKVRRKLMSVPYLTDHGTFIKNGTENVIAKQLRLRSGIYTRRTADGNVESQFNAIPNTGPGMRIFMDSDKGAFYIRHSNRKIPLYPVMRAMGVPDEVMQGAWGSEILDANRKLGSSPHAHAFIHKVYNEYTDGAQEKQAAVERPALPDSGDALRSFFGVTKLDPDTTELTLGKRYEQVTPESFLDVSKRILEVGRGEAEVDNRDSMVFQDIADFGDYVTERVQHDKGGVLRKALWKVTGKAGNLEKLPASIMDDYLKNIYNEAGVLQNIEEINPLNMYDQNVRVSRLGAGAMSSLDVASDESRGVQPSYMGFVDPIVAPESIRVGLDMRLARRARRGPDGKLYTRVQDLSTGAPVWRTAGQLARSVVGFTEDLRQEGDTVPAMVNFRGMEYVPKASVQYALAQGDDMSAATADHVPLKSAVKGMRLLMGNNHGPQALPLVSREAPLVSTVSEDGRSVSEYFSPFMGALHARGPGVVKSVHKDHLTIDYGTGPERVDMYDAWPFARKTYLRSIPKVKAGDSVSKGSLLAASNFTDEAGKTALGTNLRVAYMNYRGHNFEDAVVISDAAAKKLTSEHLYTQEVDKKKGRIFGKDPFLRLYPGKFTPDQLKKLNDKGYVKAGTVLSKGDPVVLSLGEPERNRQTLGRAIRSDQSMIWEHPFRGVVTDVIETRQGIRVEARSNVPMEVADKLAGRFGNKGVVAAVIPVSEMPRDAKGRPIDLILSPTGVTSRTNPAQMLEAALGKIAEKTGKPYVLPGFAEGPETLLHFVEQELARNNLKDTEQVTDPTNGRTIPNVFVGNTYVYKLQQTAESKGKSRAQGGYSFEDIPLKGGKSGGKHLGRMELNAFLAHGADKVLKDMKLIKGQRNDEFWRQLKLGRTPAMPGTPMIYEKMQDLIRAAGVNLHTNKTGEHIFAMTNAQAKELTGTRRIQTADTYNAKSLDPIRGGLFDPEMTGSNDKGRRWSYIKLPERYPNPIMIEPLCRVVGIRKKDLDAILSGEQDYNGKTGPAAFEEMVKDTNVDAVKQRALEIIKNGPMSKRDTAIKTFRDIVSMEENDAKPEDFLMDRVPVLPPAFRPIVRGDDMTMVADPNYMYKRMLETIEDRELAKNLPEEDRLQANTAVWNAYKAVVGVADPDRMELQKKGVGGMLKQLFGKGSPKLSMVQRRVIGTNMDMSGLSVITPNPALKLNQVGLPEEFAWELYSPFVIRDLVKHGVPATEAVKAVEERDTKAYASLQDVVKERPVLVNRAPTLFRYGIVGFWPVLTKGRSLQVSPSSVKPYNADFDGNCLDFDTEICLTLSKSALYLTESGREWFAALLNTCREGGAMLDGMETVQQGVRMCIGNFPRVGPSVKDKNGADVYEVPGGVYITSYDHSSDQVVSRPITKYTEEFDCPSVTVTIGKSKTVVVSDNESLAVFDPASGDLVKKAPRDAVGGLVPVVREEPITGTAYSAELGWWYGALVADGWVQTRTVGYAKLDDASREKFVKVARTCLTENFTSYEYKDEKNPQKFGRSAKVHLNGKELVSKVFSVYDAGGTGALHKKLPDELLTNGSKECLLGLLAGLIDGDSSIGWNTTLKRRRFFLRFNTSSKSLVHSIEALGRKLGFRCSVTITPARGRSAESYTVCPSVVDIHRLLTAHALPVVREGTMEVLEDFLNAGCGLDDRDYVAVEREFCVAAAKVLLRAGERAAYGIAMKAKSTGYAVRESLLKILQAVPADTPSYLRVGSRAANRGICWERITSVEDAGRRDVYDFEIPGTKVFAVSNGVVVYDTMSYTVPVSDEAVAEAREKMMPENLLIGDQAGRPMYSPSNEYLQGLFFASRAPRAREPILFRTEEEAVRAYRQGKINVDDPIRIADR